MGQDLYNEFKSARDVFAEADETLKFPLSRLCFEGPEDDLRQTVNLQPAIMTVSWACYRAAQEAGKVNGHFAYTAGHSLGEYTALVASQSISFSDALRLVRERGRLMQMAGEMTPSGMVAILGLDESIVEEICRETGAQIANINSPGQIVVSGAKEAVAMVMDLGRARGARKCVPLAVSGAFHSHIMRPAQEGIAEAVGSTRFRDPIVPVIANSTANPMVEAEQIRDELVAQLCNCVHWTRSVEYMVGAGVSTFVEIGPGRVLTGLIHRINGEVDLLNIDSAKAIHSLAS
ncbi:MAG: ACP S-malonyltransferase [Chloroflexi bacterium]|nr:ACP S-malonyltransferase [Chloroflexota bacterium]